MSPIKILSYGGGLNSFAMLLYAIEHGNRPDFCVFADTGSGNPSEWSRDGEWFGTYRHMVEYAIPICEQNGIQFKWITQADSKVRGESSLLRYFEKLHVVPSNGRQRYCTGAAKIERIERWFWESFGTTPLDVWIGFEAGEEGRRDKDPHGAKTCGQPDEESDEGGEGDEPGSFQRRESGSKFQINRIKSFPLISAGMCRCRCEIYVRDRGFPVPRKSACWFCPYGKRGDWMKLAEQMPEQFARAAALEENQKGTAIHYRVEVITDESEGEWIPEKPKFKTKEAAKANAEKLEGSAEAGVQKARVVKVDSRFLFFNSIERKGESIGSPLWENINLPYKPKVSYCSACCRYPKASKMPGIEYLAEAEFVAYDEPLGLWSPGAWGRGLALDRPLPPDEKPPTCEERIAAHLGASQGAVAELESEEAVAIGARNLTQYNILQWLGARLGEPVLDGVLEIPLDRVEESRKLLEWFALSTQIDRDLIPDTRVEVELLQNRLDGA